jgi:hypothetical protein
MTKEMKHDLKKSKGRKEGVWNNLAAVILGALKGLSHKECLVHHEKRNEKECLRHAINVTVIQQDCKISTWPFFTPASICDPNQRTPTEAP